mmetsp:Transcript_33534/g.74200  ORF Transcript_33534/g.74200 Transcript_33534/m.74200 type:complete len:874 (-) Transcript_33534:546-3167(-)|eukprot:CAMPEP_0202899268 /NCGR_PEP_ID=MMETSP1392-20130828/7549_1 /ASSEMBLY_ACC=CAM_ASM_000868 /TAXON_ID=225041 /ORGANISM="Chlamydomonas chlamydogama, Strain SAG 11-48b" /LENGTH=873 /DNA_ID=CAMNT_0049585401 /DNA_START=540 /DNA_END=3161 /DNA_ORIENTATION=-
MHVAGSGKSFVTPKKESITCTSSKKERVVGKKERRESLVHEDVDNDELKPWRTACRPAFADPPQDNSFTLEDEPVASTVESIMYSVTVSDPRMDRNPLVFVSPGFEVMTGYAAAEVLGANCKLLQGKAPDAEAVKQLRSGLEERRFSSVEITNYRKDGRAFQNLLCLIPMLDAYDNLTNYIGVQCDLDDRRKRDHVDEHYQAKWTEQVRHYLSAFMITDNSQDSVPIVSVNSAFTALTGYSQAELVGCSCLTLCGPDSNVKSMKKLIMSHWTDKAGAVKLLCYKKDGTPFWAYIFNCPMTADGRGSTAKHNLCVVVDITTTRLKRVGKFTLGKVIGSGASGLVRVGKSQAFEEVVAVKAVDASRFRSISEIEQIQEEMNVLSSLKHPNIIKLYEMQFINNVFFLIMEFASGGSLVKYIYSKERHCLDEDEAHRLFMQMASALDYCHRRRIIHRDLKPENILMDDKMNIKIADFGLAAVTAPFSRGLTQQCGTPEFTAPEIVNGKEYDGPSVDIWSMGVILYEMVTGTLPFRGSTQSALFKAISRGVYDPLPVHLSLECKDLVRRMLVVDPTTRCTMEEIMRHPWCRDYSVPESPLGLAMDLSPGSPLIRSPMADMRISKNGDGPPSISGEASVTDVSEVPARANTWQGTSSSSRPGSPAVQQVPLVRGSYNGGNGVHDSVRVVINSADADDPITAAMLRGQFGADYVEMLRGSKAADTDDDPGTSGEDYSVPRSEGHASNRISPSPHSYTVGSRYGPKPPSKSVPTASGGTSPARIVKGRLDSIQKGALPPLSTLGQADRRAELTKEFSSPVKTRQGSKVPNKSDGAIMSARTGAALQRHPSETCKPGSAMSNAAAQSNNNLPPIKHSNGVKK